MNSDDVTSIQTQHPLKLVYQIPLGKTKTFWNSMSKGKLVIPKCIKCSTYYFPPQGDCSNCLSSEMEWIEFSTEGKLEVFTHLMVAPGSFMDKVPYTVAIGKLSQGIKILAWLKDVEYGKVKIGMNIKLHIKKINETKYVYEWRLN